MNEEDTLQILLQEVREMGKVVAQLNMVDMACANGPLMGIKDAAKYTGRSRRTFQNEFHRGIWTSVKIGGGHPKFNPRQLDKDMQAWTQYSKFRRHEGIKQN